MKKYKYLLFDLDGTLIYSHFGIYSCFRYAMEKMGRKRPTDEQLRPVVGPSLFHSFTTFFGMSEEEAHHAVALYREEYSRTGVWENELVEGAFASVKLLSERGYTLALATAKPIVYAEKIIEKHGLTPYFTSLVGSGIDGSLNTKAEVVAECLKRLRADPSDCLMIGDRFYDAEGAKEMGVDCVLLKIGGYADEAELYGCGAAFVLENFEELNAFLV